MYPYLNSVGMICSLGDNKRRVIENLLQPAESQSVLSDEYSPGYPIPIIKTEWTIPEIPSIFNSYRTRTNQLLLAALQQIRPEVDEVMHCFDRSRIAVIIGTSTSGIAEGEAAICHQHEFGTLPAHFNYKQQEIAATADLIAQFLQLKGPAYAISTSCSSSSAAFCSAQRLLCNGLCDAVIVGGSDALCQTTIQGFHSLGAISKQACNPFSRHRDGIVIGEAAALFLMTGDATIGNQNPPIQLLGTGISSDAYHISAPDPKGTGAQLAMQTALNNTGFSSGDIDYINLHGTATPHNDSMESHAVHALFGDQTPCSSTKPLTGHCMGASGAIELALCWLLASDFNQNNLLPVHIWDQQIDPQLPSLNLVQDTQQLENPITTIMSNTYSFGGNNVSLILGTKQ